MPRIRTHKKDDLDHLDSLPTRESHQEDLQRSGRLRDLYDSMHWEQPNWNRSTQRTWKRTRRNQYRA